jgi:hypothetical protein
MRLDGEDHERTDERADALHRLDAAIRLIDIPEHWCRGVLFDDAGRRCIIGALQAVVAPVSVLDAVAAVLPRRIFWSDIASFNDSPRTSHADVMRVLSRARVRLGGEPLPGFEARRRCWWGFRFFEAPHA